MGVDMNCLMDKKYVTAAVKRIYWERVILHLDVEVYDHRSIKQKDVFEFYLLDENYSVVARLRIREIAGAFPWAVIAAMYLRMIT